jgi:large subunit ribosomal protein L20
MARVKRGVAAHKRRKYLLKRAKSYLNSGSTKFRAAKERLFKADSNAYKSRKTKKREFRSLWITRINGALDQIGSDMNYSTLINKLNKAENPINRKMLSEIAIEDINEFKKIVESVK